MHDPFPSIWGDRIAALPPVEGVTLKLSPNIYPPDDVTCVACHGRWPEWLVTMRTPSSTITSGLHERCREKSEVMRGLASGPVDLEDPISNEPRKTTPLPRKATDDD
jgi:hypothetical protein